MCTSVLYSFYWHSCWRGDRIVDGGFTAVYVGATICLSRLFWSVSVLLYVTCRERQLIKVLGDVCEWQWPSHVSKQNTLIINNILLIGQKNAAVNSLTLGRPSLLHQLNTSKEKKIQLTKSCIGWSFQFYRLLNLMDINHYLADFDVKISCFLSLFNPPLFTVWQQTGQRRTGPVQQHLWHNQML